MFTILIVIGLTTDGAAVMPATARLLNYPWFWCVAHLLNLVVQDSIKGVVVSELISTVRSVVKHFKKSDKAMLVLRKYQREIKMSELKLILDVKTRQVEFNALFSVVFHLIFLIRWSSMYDMLCRYLKCKHAVNMAVAHLSLDLPTPTTMDLSQLELIAQLLKPFSEATKMMSKQKSVHASEVRIIVQYVMIIAL